MNRTISFLMIPLLLVGALSCSTESTPAFKLTTTASPAEGGEITPNAGTFDEGEVVSLEAVPAEGWQFSRWEQDLNSTANPMNITMNRDYNVVGVFEQRMHAITIDVEGEGAVSETVVQQKITDYAEGTVVELEAVPDDNWVFSHWEGDLSGSENPNKITVNEPISIVAHFNTYPAVSTSSISSISENSALSGGNVTDDGGVAVTARGVCWSTSHNPTTNDDCTSDGSGTGSFSSNLTNLIQDTEYFVRAYATNTVGTVYGNQRIFTTDEEVGLPSVSTSSISSITENSAQSGGQVADDGGATVTARGVCWSTSQNPFISDDCTVDGNGTGGYTSNLSNLSSDTQYYVRAYATNSEGTTYGSQRNFKTDSGLDDGEWQRDTETEIVDVTNPETGKTWMDRNLGASRAATSSTDSQAYGDLYQWGRAADGHEKRDSGTITTLSSTDQPGHGNFILTSGGADDWRRPQNDDLWQGVDGVNNPCPDGYRLPTIAEWEEESQSWSSNDTDGAFASSLKLSVAGARGGRSGSIVEFGSFGYYRSSTITSTFAGFYSWSLGFYSSHVFKADYNHGNGFSVRCIKD